MPWRRRSGKSKKPSSPGEQGRDKRLDETRRIVMRVAKEALQAEQEPPATAAPTRTRLGRVTVSECDGVIHVNFHRERLLRDEITVRDPITHETRRIARRFNKSRLFYNDDGLIDNDNWVG